jgi:hypothetical protein
VGGLAELWHRESQHDRQANARRLPLETQDRVVEGRGR